MQPARQHLEPHDLAGGEVDDRLEVRHHLTPLETSAELGRGPQPVDHRGPRAGRELRRSDRALRPWPRTSPSRRRAADRPHEDRAPSSPRNRCSRDDQLLAVERDRLLEARRRRSPINRDRRCRPTRRRTRRRRSVRGGHLRERIADNRAATCLSSSVTHRMAEAVVDHLEVVEVDEQHGHLAGRSRRSAASSSMLTSDGRFGRSVRSSWVAAWVRRSAARRWSVTSSMWVIASATPSSSVTDTRVRAHTNSPSRRR